MFTGIISELGTIKKKKQTGQGATFVVFAPHSVQELSIGDSIAINGVCQTVTSKTGDSFEVDTTLTSLHKTNLGRLVPEQKVNLELALKLSDRLGGHLVTGHVNGVAPLLSQKKGGNSVLFSFLLPQELNRYVVQEGSITIDGISLTVAQKEGECVTVAVIPHTFKETTLSFKKEGDLFNIEVDLLAKYVESLFPQKKESHLLDLLKDF